MLKKVVNIKDDIFYSPSHNTFFRINGIDSKMSDEILLEISGHEEKIFEFLLGKPNQQVTREDIESEFPECADPYNKTLDRLRKNKIEGVLNLYGVLVKLNGKVVLYLQESPFEQQPLIETETLLFYRNSHYVDYDKILSDLSNSNIDTRHILSDWLKECELLKSYDEKCLFLLERLAFLPAFGDVNEKLMFIIEAKKIIYRFEEYDIRKYGNTDILLLTHNLLICVISYLEFQVNKMSPCSSNPNSQRELQRILRQFSTISIPDNSTINPLVLLVYYDYLGLANYHYYKINNNREYLSIAAEAYENAIKSASKVDMHLQIWKAFLTYNLARVYKENGDIKKSIRNYEITVELRQCLVESPFFNETVKKGLYYEYLIAKIDYIDTRVQQGLLSADNAKNEYCYTYEEFKTHYYTNNGNINQEIVEQMLTKRIVEQH